MSRLIVAVFSLVFCVVLVSVESASIGLQVSSASDPGTAEYLIESEPVEAVNRDKREPKPIFGLFDKGHGHGHHHHHGHGGGASGAGSFASASAGSGSVGGHGGSGSHASANSNSQTYSFGPFSASFSSSQANAGSNSHSGGGYGGGYGGGLFDYFD